jgi:hypothetical protein
MEISELEDHIAREELQTTLSEITNLEIDALISNKLAVDPSQLHHI